MRVEALRDTPAAIGFGRPALWSLVALAFVYGLYVAWRLCTPLEINGNEPWNAYHIDDAFSPARLYPAPEAMVSNYTPASYYVLHALAPLFPNAIVAGRALSFLSILALSVLSYAISRELGAGRGPAVFAGVWFSATLFRGYTNYAGMNDPHLFGLMLMALGFLLFLRGRGTRAVYFAFAVFVLAGLAKNSLIALPLAALALLFLERNPRRFLVLAFCGLALAAAAAALYGLYGAAVFRQLFLPRVFKASRILGAMQRLQWLAIPLVFWFVVWPRLPATAKRVTSALVACGWLAWWGTAIAEGVGTNAIFELAFAASTALASALSFAPRPSAVRLVEGLVLVRLLASFDSNPYALLGSPAFRADVERRVAGLWDDVAQVKAQEGPVSCEVVTVCYLAGKPYDLAAPRLAQRAGDRWPSKP